MKSKHPVWCDGEAFARLKAICAKTGETKLAALGRVLATEHPELPVVEVPEVAIQPVEPVAVVEVTPVAAVYDLAPVERKPAPIEQPEASEEQVDGVMGRPPFWSDRPTRVFPAMRGRRKSG